jgi:hypothetical protein
MSLKRGNGHCKRGEKQSAFRFSNTYWNGGPKGSVRVSIQLFDRDAGKRHHYIHVLRGFAEPVMIRVSCPDATQRELLPIPIGFNLDSLIADNFHVPLHKCPIQGPNISEPRRMNCAAPIPSKRCARKYKTNVWS